VSSFKPTYTNFADKIGFYINLPAGALLFPFLLWAKIPDHIPKPPWKSVLRRPLAEFDLIGFSLFAPAAIQLFLALHFAGSHYPWKSPEVIGLFCGSGAMTAIFCAWNSHQGDLAMIPFSMLRMPIMWAGCCTLLLLSGTVFVTAYFLPLYFQGVLGDSPFQSGVHFLPTILTQVGFTLLAGRLGRKLRYGVE